MIFISIWAHYFRYYIKCLNIYILFYWLIGVQCTRSWQRCRCIYNYVNIVWLIFIMCDIYIKYFHDVGYGFLASFWYPNHLNIWVYGVYMDTRACFIYIFCIWAYISQVYAYCILHVYYTYTHMCYCLTMYGSWVIKMQFQWPPPSFWINQLYLPI